MKKIEKWLKALKKESIKIDEGVSEILKWQIKRFEDLTGKEIYEILKVRNEVFVVEQQCIYQDCDNKDKKAYHLYVYENDKIIAYLRILKKGISYDEISIGRVLIEKKYRGKGLARQMMLKAMDFIKNELNETEIRISAQEYLKCFYKSVGFEEVPDAYLEDNIPHIEMLYKEQI